MRAYDRSKAYEPEILEKLHQVQLQILKEFVRVCEKYGLKYFLVYGSAIGAVRHQGFIPWDDDIDVGMLRKDYERFLKIFPKESGECYNLLTPDIDGRYACTVTHMQKKGTKFISEMSQDLTCEQCIFMDIFPFDYVAEGRLRSWLQEQATIVWGRLLFLHGTAYPVIPYGGFKGAAAALVCRGIHFALHRFRISTGWIYRQYVKTSTACNRNFRKRSGYVTSFGYVGCGKDKIKEKEMFPLKKARFAHLEVNLPANNHELLTRVYGDYMKIPPAEERVNHMPLVIDFGEEEA